MFVDGCLSLLDAREENMVILEEAASLQSCLVEAALTDSGQPADMVSVATYLTHQLLVIQEKELALLLKSVQTAVRAPL